MNILDWLKGHDLQTTTTDQPLQRGAIDDAIAAAVSQRQADFTMADALALPPIARAVDLIVSVGSTFQPVEYASGTASANQPRFVRRPDPFRSKQEFIAQTLLELVEEGEWFWLLGEWLDGYPSHAMVLPTDEVDVRWDDRRFLPVYTWRGRTLVHGKDIYHGAINRRAGELHGRSVLKSALPYLAVIDAAEAYAASSFGSGGVPSTVLKTMANLTKDEADKLKKQWAASRQASTLTGEPAIASGGIDPVFPDIDPMKMQLNEARSYGAVTVARLMGIPGPLLLAETQGSSITYQNVDAVVNLLTKVTILPRYLSPIEAALADLVPRTKTVRFNLMELVRADIGVRAGVYKELIDAGVLLPEEARAFEGWPLTPPPINDTPMFDPTPAGATDASLMSKSEVPSR